ncbi:MATE family efflux transporter [Sneathiella glossodoripedis]|uniref:MATE family efflux transporter n=1 Tax=Sneathiella glossodoripedis TaxID=418853 RepID=UPI000470E1D9|nr:MATE family efflux transporter [Sneathiella glossodoripedis]
MLPNKNSYREVLVLAWPVILSNLSVPLLGAVDTAVIGHLPDAANLGAVAIGAMIFSFLYWGFGFLRMGTTGFVSQASGAGDYSEVRSILVRAFSLGTGIAVLILVLQMPVLELALYLVESSPAVEAGASDYFYIRVWGAPAALTNYCLLGVFIGIGKTQLALATQIFMNSLNIVLDLVFVLGFDMGVSGVALATTISEYMAVGLGLLLVLGFLRKQSGGWNRSEIFNLQKFYGLMSVNRDIFIRTVLLIFAFAYFTVTAAEIGEDALAAVAVAMNFMHFLSFGLDGFAHAAESMVGNAIGARKEDRLKEVIASTSVLALLVSVGYSVVYWLFGEGIVDLLTNIESVRVVAYDYLPWLIAMPLFAVWSYQLDGIFIGAMKTKEMRNGMILSFLAYFVSISLLSESFGADGMWASMIVFMIARAVTLVAYMPRVRISVTSV